MERFLQPVPRGLPRADVTDLAGEAVLCDLERDLACVATLEQGWRRLCTAAWALGFTSLRLQPAEPFADVLPLRTASGPERDRWRERHPGFPGSAWSFQLCPRGRHAATLNVELGRDMLDFNPGRFAEAVQSLLLLFAGGDRPSSGGGQ
ncbi:MAG TPA: hypothetical protein VEQ10_12770 [Vicinamibacteria bacterium]|nr:hypothetical protein [Vicinamibacteria bacterium]